MLRQLKQHMETVRHNFMLEEGLRPQVSPEVSAFHLRREMVNLELEMGQALLVAFGEASAEVRRFREVRFPQTTPQGMREAQRLLDRVIVELEQSRLYLLEPTHVPELGIDPTTDFYTEAMLTRYLHHEIAWSQRQGESFAVLLLRLPHCADDASFTRELVISAANILKTRLRGYDVPCRVRETEFAVILRQANALDVHQRALLIATDLQAAASRIRLLTEVPVEFTCAVYPYDAETIDGLFAYATTQWTLAPPQSSETVEAAPPGRSNIWSVMVPFQARCTLY